MSVNPQPDARVVAVLGVLQIFGWGSTYYLPAILSPLIIADTGWPSSGVVGGLTVGLLVSGFVAPTVGKAIHYLGGRPVLMAAATLMASGLLVIAIAPSIPVYVAGWLLIGLGMGAGLYDASFSSLARIYGQHARGAIISLTLWGGFASTVCWPISAFLGEMIGWRSTCLAYAAIHLFVCLPLLLLVPRSERAEKPTKQKDRREQTGARFRIILILAALFSTSAAINSIIAVKLILVLVSLGHELSVAVGLGMLVGPAQFTARLLLTFAGSRIDPIWTALTSMVCVAVGIWWMTADLPLTSIAVVIYGIGNGVFWIARGTLPLALFGASSYPVLMGRISFPSLIVQALAPGLGVAVIGQGGEHLLLVVLSALALCNLVLSGILISATKRSSS